MAALLSTIAEAYSNLKSLEAEILHVQESGDVEARNTMSTRTRVFFASPDKVRTQQSGPAGRLVICDGAQIHTHFVPMKYYSSRPFPPGDLPPGSFRPLFPWLGGSGESIFLFHWISEHVLLAETLTDEADQQLIRVTYEPPAHPEFMEGSPITFWVDQTTHLISKIEFETSHRVQLHDRTHRMTHSHRFTYLSVDQDIPAETFQYTPPPGTVDDSPQSGIGVFSSGHSRHGSVESWHSNRWEEAIFVNEFKMKIRGRDFTFERRINTEGDDLQIAETITGPNGVTEREFSL